MNKFLIIIIIIFINSCGFKVVNITDKVKVNVVQINSSGEKKINYIIKNKINYSLNVNKDLENSKPIIINLKSIKSKTIKEKNIKNEITKYNISVQTNVEVYNLDNQKQIYFTHKDNGSYSVASQNSITRNNEKNIINSLSKKLAKKIINEISIKVNDL